MTTNTPLVSVIIPTFNRVGLIRETLDSVAAQTYENWECIVVDDGSTDDTKTIVKSYHAKEARIQYYERPSDRRKGGNSCRNYGFEMSRGEYICWLDSDDLFVPNKLQFQVERLHRSPYSVSVTQSERFKHEANRPYKKWNDRITSDTLTEDLILCNVAWQTAAPLWDLRVIPHKPFNEQLDGAQEWFFHILQSIRIPKSKFEFSEYPTVLIRESVESMSCSYRRDLTTRNYLNARTLLIEELSEVDPQNIPTVIQNSKRLLKLMVKNKFDFKSMWSYGKAILKYSKVRSIRIGVILFFAKTTGKGERLWQYL